MATNTEILLAQLAEILDDGCLITGQDLAQRNHGWNKLQSPPLAVVRPRSTEQVAAIMKLCHSVGQAVVPQGGKTGLTDGSATPAQELALSLELMSGIEKIDTVSRTMTVQAGTPLQTIQEAAEAEGLMFPLDLGARGSATIGGNISTNAGGNRVIRYGMTRHHILGLEAVLADGTIISAMHSVVKNNTGYDLKQWFIGSEGTLGIVTRAVLKLAPLPDSQNTALLAVADFASVSRLLNEMDRDFGGTLSAFEVMWNSFFQIATDPTSGHGKAAPLERTHPYYILVETTGMDQQADAENFQQVLEEKFEAGLVSDAVIAKSHAERDKLWQIRDNIESLFALYPLFTFDISLAIPQMEHYLQQVSQAICKRWPAGQLVTFGHLGDGNLHLMVIPGQIGQQSNGDDHREAQEIIYHQLSAIGGLISAEHGIGLEKKAFLHCSRSSAEIALMKTIKQAMDPKGILNPGKIFD